MGGISFSVSEYASSVSEIVGHKTGLCLNEKELAKLTNDLSIIDSSKFLAPKDNFVRIRSEDYQSLISWLLYKTGYTDRHYQQYEHISIFHKYKHDKESLDIYIDIISHWSKHIECSLKDFHEGKIESVDPSPTMRFAAQKYGKLGLDMAYEYIMALEREMQISPWSNFRRVNWKDTKKLEDLFKSESLESNYGEFFDQRFVHYLINNFDDIGKIHWRQFEGLTGEYFVKKGFHVEIGAGRDDGGIDLRVWKESEDSKSPASILVQCKRQKKKIEKVVVKALWADMVDENVESGLIVTTSSISPGAKQVCVARGYNIDEANRDTMKKWLLGMRHPDAGVFMGE